MTSSSSSSSSSDSSSDSDLEVQASQEAAPQEAAAPAQPDDEAAPQEAAAAVQPDDEVLAPPGDEATELPPPPEEWQQWAEDEGARNYVFLVTFAAVLVTVAAEANAMGVPLRTLEEVSREMIRDAILDAVANPSADTSRGRGGRPRTIPLSVAKMVIFLEMPLHFHVAVRLSSLSRFAPLKAALRSRHGLASHWFRGRIPADVGC
jgi:hypothetical protein